MLLRAMNESTITPQVDAGPSAPTGNWLLAALGEEARATLLSQAMRVRMRRGDLIAGPGQPIEHAWFPEVGTISLAAKMADGHTVEIGTTGWEGMFPVAFIHGVASTPGESVVQVDGEAWCVPRASFEAMLASHPDAERMMRRYANSWLNQVGLHGACNAVHTVDERLARWILSTHDRMPTDVLPLTHEFLSIMLGVRRASVTVSASLLREAGLIDYVRGKIRVLDRARLEEAACPCYHAMRNEYDSIHIPRLVTHS
jgi:CRP-like cAMP-binding protein